MAKAKKQYYETVLEQELIKGSYTPTKGNDVFIINKADGDVTITAKGNKGVDSLKFENLNTLDKIKETLSFNKG